MTAAMERARGLVATASRHADVLCLSANPGNWPDGVQLRSVAAIAAAGLALREACPAPLVGQDDTALMYMPVWALRAFDADMAAAVAGEGDGDG